MARLALIFLLGCSRAAHVVPVAVVAWPSPVKPRCEVPDLPTPPDLVTYEHPTSGDLDRYYVTLRQIQEMVAWHADVRHWGDAVSKCLAKLADVQ